LNTQQSKYELDTENDTQNNLPKLSNKVWGYKTPNPEKQRRALSHKAEWRDET
jgi:hypothetical protein